MATKGAPLEKMRLQALFSLILAFGALLSLYGRDILWFEILASVALLVGLSHWVRREKQHGDRCRRVFLWALPLSLLVTAVCVFVPPSLRSSGVPAAPYVCGSSLGNAQGPCDLSQFISECAQELVLTFLVAVEIPIGSYLMVALILYSLQGFTTRYEEAD